MSSRPLTTRKPCQRQQFIRANVDHIVLLKTLRYNAWIHFNGKHDQIDGSEYFIDLANLLLIFEVDPRVEVGDFGFGLGQFTDEFGFTFVYDLAAFWLCICV
jgi:hypothetical protein